MGESTLTIDEAFRLASSHANLYRMPHKDRVLVEGHAPFVGYDPKHFRPVCGSRTSEKVAVTYYSSEKASRVRFQNMLGATSDGFETYSEGNAAIHPTIKKRYPKQGFVLQTTRNASALVLINDEKGGNSTVGIDDPKAAFFKLFSGAPDEVHRAHLQRMMPADCTEPMKVDEVRGCVKPRDGHPMAACYKENVYIAGPSSRPAPAEMLDARYSWRYARLWEVLTTPSVPSIKLNAAEQKALPLFRDGFEFLRTFWMFAQRLKDLRMHELGIARPLVRGSYVTEKPKTIARTAIVGPFADRASARAYLAHLCWPVENQLDPAIAWFCRGAKIYAEKWSSSTSAIRRLKGRDDKNVATAEKRKPQPRRMADAANLVVARRTAE